MGLYDAVWGYTTQYGVIRRSMGLYDAVWGYATQYGVIRRSMGLYDAVWGYTVFVHHHFMKIRQFVEVMDGSFHPLNSTQLVDIVKPTGLPGFSLTPVLCKTLSQYSSSYFHWI